jgi:hypothetical protein
MKNNILYPVFVQFLPFVQDDFWKYVYKDLSIGKCPYGLSIHKNYLYSYIKGKEFAYRFQNDKGVKENFLEIDALLRKKVGILSEQEKIVEQMRVCRQRVPVQHKNDNNSSKDEWTQVKRKMIRDTLLEHYVITHTFRYSLPMEFAKRILSLLIIGFMFKTITSRDIIFHNGFIHHIDGIEFQDKNVRLTRNILCTKPSQISDESSVSSVRTLQSYWPIYLEECRLYK